MGGKQLVMFPALWASHRVDWTQPSAQMYLAIAFSVVACVGWLLLVRLVGTIARSPDTNERVMEPGESANFPAKAEDGSISLKEYDLGKVKELKSQFLVSVGITTFLNFQR